METAQIRIRISEEDELDALETIADSRPEIETEVVTEMTGDVDAAIAPVVAVLVSGVAIAWVSELVWEWINRVRGGLVIDLRPEALDTIYRDPDIPYGFVLTYPADGGEVKVDARDAPMSTMERLLSSFIEGAVKNIKDVVSAAKEAVGSGRVALEEPTSL